MIRSSLLFVTLALLCAACRPASPPTGPLSELPGDAYAVLDRRVKGQFDVENYTVTAVQKSQSGKFWCIVFDPPLEGSLAGQSLLYDYAVVQPDGNSWQAVMVEDHQGGIVLDVMGCKAVYKELPVAEPSMPADVSTPVDTSLPTATSPPEQILNFSLYDGPDAALPGYVDVLGLEMTLSDAENVEAAFTLRKLPATITVGREGVPEDRAEYSWCASVFLDPSQPREVPDYGLCHQYWKSDADSLQDVTIESSGQTAVWQYSPDGSFSLVEKGSIEVDYQAGTITLRGKIPGITQFSRISFIALDYLEGQDEWFVPQG